MDSYRTVLPRLRGFLRTVPGMVLAYAVLAGMVIALSDVLILAADSDWLGYFLAFKGALVACVTGAALVLLMRRDQDRDLAVQQELYQARHDPSTKLLSRGEWIKRVDAVLSDTLTRNEPAAVITVLVDSYDHLVHRHGSGAMHQWLSVFGRYLRMQAKGDDLVGSVSPGVRVCAEGMESRAQMDMLAGYDCDEVQGFFYGEPGPGERLIEEVKRSLPASRPGCIPEGVCAVGKGASHVGA